MIRKRHKSQNSAIPHDPHLFDSLMAKATWSRHSPPWFMDPPYDQRPPTHFRAPSMLPSHAPPQMNQSHRNGRIAPYSRHRPYKPLYAIPSRRGMQDPGFDQGPLPRRNLVYRAHPQKWYHQSKPILPLKVRPPQKANTHKSVAKPQQRQVHQPAPNPPFDKQPQHQIPPKLKSPPPPSSPPPATPQAPCLTPPKPSPDSWRIHYLLEKERLAPCDKNPYALHFFHADQSTTNIMLTTESKFTAHRTISAAYTPEQLFGLGPSRKVEVRDVPVTFSQIWNREVIWRKWDAIRQDDDGWLDFRECTLKIQLQRQHGPGTLFFVQEGGDESVLEEEGTAAPDVGFRLVDADGQRFTRVDKWDLQTTVYGSCCGEGALIGVDGREIRFEIEEGARQVRIAEEGMPSDWEGKSRGDLIVDIVSQQ